jgi:hypothetical protein
VRSIKEPRMLSDLPLEIIASVAERCEKLTRASLRRTCKEAHSAVDPPILDVRESLASVEIATRAIAEGLPLTRQTFAFAAQHGAPLDVMKLLHERGCGRDTRVVFFMCKRDDVAALEWARANDFPWNYLCCAYVMDREYEGVLRWLSVHECPCGGTYHDKV